MKQKLPEYLSFLFWDVEKESIDLQRHAKFIMRRILEFGDEKAINWLRSTYPENLINQIVKEKKGISPKTTAFWREYFNKTH